MKLRERLDALVEDMLAGGIRMDEARRELERRFIIQALGQADGSLTEAAAKLGMHRNTLGRKLAEYRIRRQPRR